MARAQIGRSTAIARDERRTARGAVGLAVSHVIEALEPRVLLSGDWWGLNWQFDWANVDPELIQLTIDAEREDPRYAMLLNAGLQADGIPLPPGLDQIPGGDTPLLPASAAPPPAPPMPTWRGPTRTGQPCRTSLTQPSVLITQSSSPTILIQHSALSTQHSSRARILPSPRRCRPHTSTTSAAWAGCRRRWSSTSTSRSPRRSTDGANFTSIGSIDASSTTYADADVQLLDGATYYYRVLAENVAAESAPSNVVSASIPLAAPTNLVASASGSAVQLMWSSTSTGATGFEVERSTDGHNFASIGGPLGLNTTYTDLATAVGTHYYYRVRATSGSQVSNPSNVADATTAPTMSLSVPADQPLPLAEGEPVVIDIATTYNGADPGTSVSIDWGDGQTSSGPDNGSASHVYAVHH